MRRLLTVASVLCLSILLVGCGGGSSGEQTITFGGFHIDISEQFRSIPVGLVENKQITNKVLAAYKVDTPEAFDENIIVTTSLVGGELDFEQFWTINTNKLLDVAIGYTPGDKELMSFDCEDERIEGILVSFQIEDSYFNKARTTYHISQYQFVYDQKGYIISYAHDSRDTFDNMKDIVKTLGCGTGEEETTEA